MSALDERDVKWCRLSAKLYLDPHWRQFAQEHPSAAVLWMTGLSYCADVAGTRMAVKDGFIPRFIATSVLCGTDQDIRLLEAAGYWRRDEDGWIVNGWLNWQRSGEDIDRLRNARAEAGRKGGTRTRKANRKQTGSKSQASASHESADSASKAEAKGKQTGSKTDPYTDTEADTDTDTDTDTDISFSSSAPSLAASRSPSDDEPAVEMDGTWQPDQSSRDWAAETWKDIDIEEARLAFTSHWLGKSKPASQWQRLWRGWLTRHAKSEHTPRRRPHKHTWMCAHTLAAAHVSRDQATDSIALLQYVAAGLNKGYTPGLALVRAQQAMTITALARAQQTIAQQDRKETA